MMKLGQIQSKVWFCCINTSVTIFLLQPLHPSFVNGEDLQYLVTYKGQDDDPTITLNSITSPVRIKGLKDNQAYIVNIVAQNEVGKNQQVKPEDIIIPAKEHGKKHNAHFHQLNTH